MILALFVYLRPCNDNKANIFIQDSRTHKQQVEYVQICWAKPPEKIKNFIFVVQKQQQKCANTLSRARTRATYSRAYLRALWSLAIAG